MMFLCDLQDTVYAYDVISNDADCMVIINRFIKYGFALFLDALDICVDLLKDKDIYINYCSLDLRKLYKDLQNLGDD